MNIISTAENVIKFLEKRKNNEELIKRLKKCNPKEYVLLHEENGETFIGDFKEER